MSVTSNVNDKRGKTARAEGRPVCLLVGRRQGLHLVPQPGASATWAQVHVRKGTWVGIHVH